MDYLTLKAAVAETVPGLEGKSFLGASQTASGEVLVRLGGGVVLLSPAASRPGLFLVPSGVEVASEETPFSDALNARLRGSSFQGLSLPFPGERLAEFSFTAGWPRRDSIVIRLILELMGRHSNLVLLDGGGRILAAWKTVSPSASRVHPVVPGRLWSPPPRPDTPSVEEPGPADLPAPTPKALQAAIRGLSPLMAAEALARGGGKRLDSREEGPGEPLRAKGGGPVSRRRGESPRGPDDLPQLGTILKRMAAEARGGRGFLSRIRGKPVLSPFPLLSAEPGSTREFPSLSEAAWAWRETGAGEEGAFRADSPPPPGSGEEPLPEKIRDRMARLRKEITKVEAEGDRCAAFAVERARGEALLIALREVPSGRSSIALPHPHEPGRILDISLDPSLPPAENAERHFQEARRMERGLKEVKARKRELGLKLKETGRALSALEGGDDTPARKILGGPSAGRPRSPQPRGWPGPGRRFERDGFAILVGRSAADNERVTFEAAGPEDLWLHARDYPGSHVAILAGGREVPREIIHFAAALAAANSSARKANTVEITLTRRKWVRKVKGGKPGLVQLQRAQTVTARRNREGEWGK